LTSSKNGGSSKPKLVALVTEVRLVFVFEIELSIELRDDPLVDLGIRPYPPPSVLGIAPLAESASPVFRPKDLGITLE
jgi:hypothetical protein